MRRRVELLCWVGNRLGKPLGFERLMRFLAPPQKLADIPEVCLVRDGTLFVTRLTLPIGWHVGFFGSYEPELRDIMCAVLAADAIAVDVGANTGWHTLLMGRLVGPGGRVLAVEPNPFVREQLDRNVRLNRVTQAEILDCAFGAAAGTLNFLAPQADDPSSASGHVVFDDGAKSASISVPASTLDIVAAEKQLARLDLLKIDAEGYEWPILQGAEKTIARFRPAIIFEFDQAYAVRGSESSALFLRFFQRHGYRLFSVGRHWAELIGERSWPANANIFAAPLS